MSSGSSRTGEEKPGGFQLEELYFSHSVDISFWNRIPQHDYRLKHSVVFETVACTCFFLVILLLRLCFSGVTPPVVFAGVSIFLSALTLFSFMFPPLECAEPEHEVPGKNSLWPAGEWASCSSTSSPPPDPVWPQDLISPHQNKVLAIIDAIEAAQFLISQNATHVINRVRIAFNF